MWQPEIQLKPASYPAGGVAPSSYALALYNYIQKISSHLRRR